MQMNSIQGRSGQYPIKAQSAPVTEKEDPLIKSIEKQIDIVQKRLDKLSENKELSIEESMKRRQKLEKQLDTLQKELSQRQLEVQREKQVKEKSKVNETQDNSSQAIHNETNEKLTKADTTLKHLGTLRSTQVAMKGRARVLKSEIKTDQARGISTESKEEELEKINNHLKNNVTDLKEDLLKDQKNDIENKEKEDIEIEEEKEEKVLYTKDGLKVELEDEDVETITI